MNADGFGIIRLPSEVRFGDGVRASIAPVARRWGARILVVVDPALESSPEFADVVRELETAGATTRILSDVPPELPRDAVERSAADVAGFAPEAVIGYGGGSALDAAKLISLLLAHGGPLDAYYGENAVPGPVIPLIAVPTTAGTGSEVTPVAVVGDPDRALKVGVSSPHLVPRVAFVDPRLTVSAPRGVTTFAGADAFVHAVESFTAARLAPADGTDLPVFVGRNALTEPLSREAARLIFRALPQVLDAPTDLAQRSALARGSLYAGMAFGAAGTHLSHAIQYPIGAFTHTPHGLGTGSLLPYVLQALVATDAVDRIADLAEVLEIDEGGTPTERAQAAVDAIADFCVRIGLPIALADIGVRPEDAGRIVDLTLGVGRLVRLSPAAADRELIARIVDAAIAGDRSMLR